MASKIALASLLMTGLMGLAAQPVAAQTVKPAKAVKTKHTVAAAESIQKIMAKVDATLTNVKDQTYRGEVKVIRDGVTKKTMKFTVKMMGLRAKLVRFTAPGDVRGMTVLTTPEGQMYVYLPSYKRVRRIADHVRNQSFMGTDISPEDLGAAALSVGWNHEMVNEDDKKWVLDLTPQPGNETTYKKLRIHVLKKYGGVSKLEYFNQQDKVVKEQIREQWKTFGPITLPTMYTFNDVRTGSKTVMEFHDCTVNQGITANEFSKRAILRAH